MKNSTFLSLFFRNETSLIVDVANGTEYSQKTFWNEIEKVASEISPLNLTPNSIVLIYGYRNAFATMTLFFSCIKNELIPCIVESGNFEKFKDLKYNAIITNQKIETISTTKCTDITYGKIYTQNYNDIYIGCENSLVIVSSSGSTSTIPKKILLGKEQTIFNIESNSKALGITPNDTTLVLLPLSYSYGLIAQFLTHLYQGANIILSDKVLGILQLDLLASKYKVTNIFMTPILARLFISYKKQTPVKHNSHLRFVTLGGDKTDNATLKALHMLLGCQINGTYGLAEAGPRVATNNFNLSDTDSSEISLGKINPGIEASIVTNKKYQRLCNEHKVGFLQLNTSSIYLGYINGKKLEKPESDQKLTTKDICVSRNNQIYLLGRENQYVINDNKVIWFYQMSKHFYEIPQVLKVEIQKQKDQKLNILIHHRNAGSLQNTIADFEAKYDFKYGKNYELNMVEFKNTKYK